MGIGGRLIEAAVAVGVAAVVAGGAVAAVGWGAPEWVFLTVLGTVAILVAVSGVRAVRRAARHDRRARELAGLEPAVLARRAVRAERHRLSVDIAAGLRETAGAVLDDVTAARIAADPRPALRRIHRRSQEATGELRRQLGLLRGEDLREPPAPSSPGPRLGAVDLAVGVAAVAVAVVECWAYPRLDAAVPVLTTPSLLLTLLAAAATLGFRCAPGAAAVVAALAYATGTLVGAPLAGGFWVLGPCLLVHAVVARRERRWSDLAAGLALLVAAAAHTWRSDPVNVPVLVVIMLVAAGSGALRRRQGLRQQRADRIADAATDALDGATRAAVSGERLAFAREMHDVVSHSVGVLAVQSAAAQVSWPHDPAAVRRALDVIETTARVTLAELERLPGPPANTRRDRDELIALVDRVRAAGTPVELRLEGPVGSDSAPVTDVAYRVVQEALTNVVRHAPGAHAAVLLAYADDELTVSVTDDGPGAGPGADRGYGLVGLDERVRFAGGRLTVRTGEPGFAVVAVLPIGVAVGA